MIDLYLVLVVISLLDESMVVRVLQSINIRVFLYIRIKHVNFDIHFTFFGVIIVNIVF